MRTPLVFILLAACALSACTNGGSKNNNVANSNGGYQLNQLIERHYICDGDKVQIVYEKTDNNVEGQKSVSEFLYREPAYVMIEPASLKQGTAWSYALTQKIQKPGEAPIELDTPMIVEFTVLNEQEIQLPTGKVKALLI